MDANALKRRDELFAARLARRDESVLVEIDRAYASGLTKLLRQRRGQDFGDSDIEEIISDVLKAMWLDYDPQTGAAVRTFYFWVGRARMIDRLRRNGRYRAALRRVAVATSPTAISDGESPAVVLERIERSRVATQINVLIEKAVAMLTTRQRLAFIRRFSSRDNESWATELAAEQGRTAKYWRKASHEARQKVEAFLITNGVRYSKKGGHYEIAKSRNSA